MAKEAPKAELCWAAVATSILVTLSAVIDVCAVLHDGVLRMAKVPALSMLSGFSSRNMDLRLCVPVPGQHVKSNPDLGPVLLLVLIVTAYCQDWSIQNDCIFAPWAWIGLILICSASALILQLVLLR